MPKLRSVIVAHSAKQNQNIPTLIDYVGVFDNLVQPLYPYPMQKLSMVLTFEEILVPTEFEIRVNSPTDDLITKGQFTPVVDQFGYGKKIIDLENVLVKDRGIYTIDIFIKENDELKFLSSSVLFIADYPVQRQLTENQIKQILASDEKEIIRTVKIDFRPLDNPEKIVHLQYSLDKNAELQEGYEKFPENNQVVIEGKSYDLTGIKREMEWMFGNPIPKASPVVGETKEPVEPKKESKKEPKKN